MATASQIRRVRFGAFEADLRSGELFKYGVRIKVQDQPFQILAMLLDRPGELVSREELRHRLWAQDTFVDFDAGLNAAVRRLRDALNDSPDQPRFIETLPRHGYRFIASAYAVPESQPQVSDPSTCNFPTRMMGTEGTLSPVSAAPHRLNTGWSPWTLPSSVWIWSFLFIAIAIGASILGITSWRSRYFSTRAASGIRSIAILPLQNLSSDSNQDYFADGMTDALITDLAHAKSLRVISRSSSMQYKDSKKSAQEVGRELNVDAIFEGAVVRSGDEVRIDARLIRTADDQHLWARTYRRKISDILSLQEEVALAIADEIQVSLPPDREARLANARPIIPQAYSDYLLGQYFLERGGKENLEKAVGYYEQSIQIDPHYALAWAGLADAHRFLGGGGFAPEEAELRNARAAVERALELDPNLAEAHAARGSIQMFADWDWNAAEASYQRALAVEPANISALRGSARLAADLGRYDQALQLARQAAERDPLNPRSHRLVGDIAHYANELDEALAAFQKADELNPGGPLINLSIGWVYLEQSRPLEALAAMEREKSPEFRLPGLALAYHALGKKKASDDALMRLIDEYGNTAAFQVAEVYAFRNEPDRAFEWLERAYQQREGSLTVIRGDPLLKNVERDPRYVSFLKKMRLPV